MHDKGVTKIGINSLPPDFGRYVLLHLQSSNEQLHLRKEDKECCWLVAAEAQHSAKRAAAAAMSLPNFWEAAGASLNDTLCVLTL